MAPADLIRSSRRKEGVPRHPWGMMKWTPSFFRRPDGSFYEAAIHTTGGVWNRTLPTSTRRTVSQAFVRSAGPRCGTTLYPLRPRWGAALSRWTAESRDVIEVEALGESGFFLKTRLRLLEGSHPWFVDGVRFSSTVSTSPTAGTKNTWRLLGQLRDTPIRVREGDATGYGIMESIIGGEWPEFGLTAESDRAVSYL